MAASATRGRPAPATIALVLAALLAAAALAYALFFRPGDDAAAAPQANAAAGEAGSVDEMIAGLTERLRQDPDNHEGWFLLGMALRNSERFAEAGQAFRRAMELAPQNADYTAYLGEMLILAADTPPPEAERLFRRALALQPANAQARYYLATMKDMRGDHRGALDDLIALLNEAPPGAPWEPQVRGAATAIARANNIDLAGRLPAAPAAPAQSAATAAIPGPTAEQMAAASAIPPREQDAMGRQMADRLAARLRANPRDEARWIMLMRSRMVLGDPRAASEALRAGLAAYQDDAATQTRLRQAARELGVPAG